MKTYKRQGCNHYYPSFEQRSGYYWLICQECGYKHQLRNIQKPSQAEEVMIAENKRNKRLTNNNK